MTHIVLPAIWLIILIVGLPQLSETVYSPALPEIATALKTTESMVEYTLTIYLFGFAVGTLVWGKLSDRIGRKPGVLAGLFIFFLGCIGCYFSTTITQLLISRFVQAFGGSIGSVLGQAICRDAFHGSALGKVYSAVGGSLALFPAVGPVVGGFISEHSDWSNIFLFLMLFCNCAVFFSFKATSRNSLQRKQGRNKHLRGCKKSDYEQKGCWLWANCCCLQWNSLQLFCRRVFLFN